MQIIASLGSAADSYDYSTRDQLIKSNDRDNWHRLNDVTLTPESQESDWFADVMQRKASKIDFFRSATGALLPLPLKEPFAVRSPTWSPSEEFNHKYVGLNNNELHKPINWSYSSSEVLSQQYQNQSKSKTVAEPVRKWDFKWIVE